ncbi:MAG: NUDIX domain-containing protein [Minisyncoccia bacterium]
MARRRRHIELDEDPNEAAIREVKEEVGLTVELWDGNKLFNKDFSFGRDKQHLDLQHRELIPPIALNRHSISAEHEHIDLLYFARSSTDAVVPENPDDVWRWCTRVDLRGMDLLDDVRFYAELALETLSGNN